ncbi:MAG TPA: cytochrome c oxidase subunit II [Anaerolineales bacterium]|nr:cytochrome c oxidase subunit II [Anaerolineales bacterium]
MTVLRSVHRRSLVAAVLAAGLLAGCAGSPSFLEPSSMIASRQAALFRLLLVPSAAVFLLVEGWLIFNVVRFRRRSSDQGLAPQVHGHPALEITWTVLPILLVTALFVLTVGTINAIAAPAGSPQDIRVHVIGHRWWWEFEYPDLHILTANELHVPANAVVQIQVDSVDVIHSFWVPQLSGKVDAIPGQTNELWFRADQPGEYYGQCSEYCGLNHANMRVTVIVDTPQDFDAWVENQQAPPPQPDGELAQKGHDLITQGICSNCHILGLEVPDESHQPSPAEAAGVRSHVGPNLNHLLSRSMIAGETIELTEANLASWLTQNQVMKPGNDMVVNLTDEDVAALMAYLKTLK